jgi:hypothetical protein
VAALRAVAAPTPTRIPTGQGMSRDCVRQHDQLSVVSLLRLLGLAAAIHDWMSKRLPQQTRCEGERWADARCPTAGKMP